MTSPTIIPMLAYEDGPAAMDWLAEAFGFVETTRSVSDAGTLEHEEMTSGGGTILLATPSEAYEGPNRHRAHCQAADAWFSSPYVVDGVLVDDVDAHHARAEAAGARLMSGIEDAPPGRLYRVEDLEGHRWMFLAAERSLRSRDSVRSRTCPGRGPQGRDTTARPDRLDARRKSLTRTPPAATVNR